jgi:transposase-like protein
MKKTPQMRMLEAEGRISLADVIRDRLEDGRTLDQVASELGITRLTLRDWIRNLDLRVVTRKTVVAREANDAAV